MKFSVIIPTYNPKYLRESLQSIKNQNYKSNDVDVIVIDDCSTIDFSDQIAGFDITLLKTEKNSGPSVARNLGIQHARGEYIAFQDDDDISLTQRLAQTAYEFEKEPGVGMVCGNYQIIANGRLQKPFYTKKIKIDYDALMSRNFVATGSVAIRRKILERIKISDGVYFNPEYWICEDYECWLKVSEITRICYLQAILYLYRVVSGGGSLTQRSTIQAAHLSNIARIKTESKKRMESYGL